MRAGPCSSYAGCGCLALVSGNHPVLVIPAHQDRVQTGLSGGHGHSVHDGTDAIIAYALSAPGGPTGTFARPDLDRSEMVDLYSPAR